jgi:hypothetical protein
MLPIDSSGMDGIEYRSVGPSIYAKKRSARSPDAGEMSGIDPQAGGDLEPLQAGGQARLPRQEGYVPRLPVHEEGSHEIFLEGAVEDASGRHEASRAWMKKRELCRPACRAGPWREY